MDTKPLISRERAEHIAAICNAALVEDPQITLDRIAARIQSMARSNETLSPQGLRRYRADIRKYHPDIELLPMSYNAYRNRSFITQGKELEVAAGVVFAAIDGMVEAAQASSPERGCPWDEDPSAQDYSHATLCVSDAHCTDVDCLYDSLLSAAGRAAAMMEEFSPDAFTLLMLGDMVSGNDIFRGQAVRNSISRSHWQAAVGAALVRHLWELARPASARSGRIVTIQGNHDKDATGNYAFALAKVAVATYGLPVSYVGHQAVVNVGSGECPVYVIGVHGSGGGRFSPRGPAFLDSMLRRVSDLNALRPKREQIRRVVHGHTHWADIDFKFTMALSFDSCGGWQYNSRPELGLVQRPPGLVLYLHRGKKLRVEGAAPEDLVYQAETNSGLLEFTNLERMGALLKEAFRAEHPGV